MLHNMYMWERVFDQLILSSPLRLHIDKNLIHAFHFALNVALTSTSAAIHFHLQAAGGKRGESFLRVFACLFGSLPSSLSPQLPPSVLLSLSDSAYLSRCRPPPHRPSLSSFACVSSPPPLFPLSLRLDLYLTLSFPKQPKWLPLAHPTKTVRTSFGTGSLVATVGWPTFFVGAIKPALGK